MRRVILVLAAVLVLCQPVAGQDAARLGERLDSLASAIRTESVRQRGFVRAAETQGTKLIALADAQRAVLDSLTAIGPVPGDTTTPPDTTTAPPDTVQTPPPVTGAVRFESDWSGAGLTDGGKWQDYGWGAQMSVGTRAGLAGNALRVAQGGGGDLMEATFTPPAVGQTLVIEFVTVAEPGGGGVDHGLQSNIGDLGWYLQWIFGGAGVVDHMGFGSSGDPTWRAYRSVPSGTPLRVRLAIRRESSTVGRVNVLVSAPDGRTWSNPDFRDGWDGFGTVMPPDARITVPANAWGSILIGTSDSGSSGTVAWYDDVRVSVEG